MAVSTVAFRYAKSLIDLAQEQGLVETMYNDMRFFRQTVRESRGLMLLLRNPIVRIDRKYAVLDKVFSGRINPISMSFLNIITRKNRESIMDAIADEYIRLYDEMKGIEHASITTTMPLTDALREHFKTMVINAVGGKTVELEERIDPKLIGGYVLRAGDRQVDASLRNRLNEVRMELLNN